MSEAIKPEINVWESVSPDDVRKKFGELILGPHAVQVGEKRKNIRLDLLDKFHYDVLELSPYFHALAGSTPQNNLLLFDSSDKDQRMIAEVVIAGLKILQEQCEIPVATRFHEEVQQYLDAITIDLQVIVLDRLKIVLKGLQKKYPQYKLNKIPEIQFLIGGSERVHSDDIPLEVVKEVTEELTREYLFLVETISKIK